MTDKKKYIYESPDGGKTLYRREFGDYKKRELVREDDVKHSSYYYELDRNRPFNDGQAKQGSPEYDRADEFDSITNMLERADEFDLQVEVIWSTLKAMQRCKGNTSILTALQAGAQEWDI